MVEFIMPRLFLTPREINLFSDLAKEVVKDVVGQKIYLYQISESKTNIHDIYEESPDKIFDNPIELECLVEYSPQSITTNQFGSEEYFSIKAYIQTRDLIDKGIEILEGDFFSYGSTFFEIVTSPDSETIMGQIEYSSFITITGKQSRKGQFTSKVFGPTSEKHTDSDAVQDSFYQQRGFESNKKGSTADKRDLVSNGTIEKPITKPKEISRKAGKIPGFYGD
jgi:hypothetical protein